jgi:pimeloyl-ACP methyl ester carboxylesterase
MIHGLGGQLRNFSYGLAHRLGDRRLVMVDRPGSGYSRSRPMGIADQAQAIATLIARLGLQRPLIVGHSLGGAVALAMALNHPGRVGALALVAPLTQVQPDVPAAFEGLARMPAAARLPFAWTLGTPLARLTGKHTLEQVFAPEPVPDDFPTRGGGLLASRPGNIDAASYELGHVNEELATMVPRYPELKLPVAILYAREDKVLDPELQGRPTVDMIPNARLEMMEGGHMTPVTQPERVATFIRGVR